MDKTKNVKTIGIVIMAVLLVIATICVVAYQRGVTSHAATLNELDAELRDLVQQREDLEKEAKKEISIDTSTPLSDYIKVIRDKAQVAVDLQNEYLSTDIYADLEDLHPDDVESYTASNCWYMNNSIEAKWEVADFVITSGTGNNTQDILWQLKNASDGSMMAVARGHYDAENKVVVVDEVYSTTFDIDVINNDPYRPDAMEYTGNEDDYSDYYEFDDPNYSYD